jgi:putative endonuclease
MGAWLYIIQCSDGSYYTGTTRGELELRIEQHQTGHFDGYTATRRPVVLKFAEYFDRIADAIAAEQQIKRWSRAKKEALIAGNFRRLSELAKRRTDGPHGSRRARSARAPHHEG